VLRVEEATQQETNHGTQEEGERVPSPILQAHGVVPQMHTDKELPDNIDGEGVHQPLDQPHKAVEEQVAKTARKEGGETPSSLEGGSRLCPCAWDGRHSNRPHKAPPRRPRNKEAAISPTRRGTFSATLVRVEANDGSAGIKEVTTRVSRKVRLKCMALPLFQA